MEPRISICLVVLSVLHVSRCTPPKITVPDQKLREDIMEKEQHTLRCVAQSSSELKYQWKFNGSPVDSTAVEVDEATGTLTIDEFREKHEGSYQCIVESEISPGNVAVAMSPVITLRLVKLELDWPENDNFQVEGTEGDYMNLTCDNAPKSVPAAQFSWYLAEGKESEGQIETSDRVYIGDDGTLHFMYLVREDQNKLLYKCGMSNTRLSLILLGSQKNLTVEHIEGGIPNKPPESKSYTKDARFLRTRDAVLECVFSGYPIPTTSWYDSKKNIISPTDGKYALSDNNRKLTILDLTEKDEGLYWCKGSNGDPDDDKEESIFLDVTSGPIWVTNLSSQTVVEGKDANFSCKARPAIGDDDLNPPEWFKNGKPLPASDTTKFQFSDKARVLTVKNLNKTTDIMCFQCNVSNDIGYELGDGCLSVIEPITITTQPSLEQQITKGVYVNLTVIGKTDPAYTLEYRWYFRNVTYNKPDDAPPYVILNETSRHAYINTSDLTDEEYDTVNGTYILELYHADDKLNVSIEVILLELPVPVTVVAAGVDLWWIALIVALVILLIVIILIVVICNRKRQEGMYPLDKSERAHDMDPEKELANSAFQDLSRAPEDEDYPYVKTPDLGLSMDDDDISLIPSRRESQDSTNMFYNEDGSFIGEYGKKKR